MARRVDRHRLGVSRWFILRTSGGQTLALMASLVGAGFDAWTPARTLRRYMPAKTPSGKRLFETDVPILPTFVFAREGDLQALAIAAEQDPSPHPAFSIFRHGGRVPLVGDREVAGLREEEAREAAMIKAMREAESHAEAERIRRAAIKSASARRRAEQALEREQRHERRSQRTAIAPGTPVEVAGVPALVGVTGVMGETEGHYARVRFGAHSWKIEGWQVMPAASHDNPAPRSLAA